MQFYYSENVRNEYPHSFSIFGLMSTDAWQAAISFMDSNKSKLGRLGQETYVYPNPDVVAVLEENFGPIGKRWVFDGHGTLISVCFKFKNKTDAMRFRLMYDNV